MPTLPKITIVTPCFNSRTTIGETIESVRAQAYPALEHIVIDGGSTDGTLDLLRAYPDLQWESERDEGHYHAMDKGIRKATGEIFGVLNADDCYRPGVLAAVAAAFAAHPEWEGVYGDMIYVDGAGWEIFRREEGDYDPQLVLFGFSPIIHQAFFVRRETYLRLGGYRYREFKNCCDFDFVYRMARAGCAIGHVPMFFVNYRYHEFGQSADRRVVANMIAETTRILAEGGIRPGWRQRVLMTYARIKRQWIKLRDRGHIDLVPGHWVLRKHMRARTTFSSNCGVDKLGEVQPRE